MRRRSLLILVVLSLVCPAASAQNPLLNPALTNAQILANCRQMFRSNLSTDRSFAIATMGLMGSDARGASRDIVLAFLDPAAAVQEAANLAMPQVNPPLYQPIKNILNTGNTADAYRARLSGVQDLAALGADAEPALPILLNFMNGAQPTDRPQVVAALAAVGYRDADTVSRLYGLLSGSPNQDVRIAAQQALPKMLGDLLAALLTGPATPDRGPLIGTLLVHTRSNPAAIPVARAALTRLATDRANSAAVLEAAKQALESLPVAKP